MKNPATLREPWRWAIDTLARVESDTDAKPSTPPGVSGAPWLAAVEQWLELRRGIDAADLVRVQAALPGLRRLARTTATTMPELAARWPGWLALLAGHVAYGRSHFSRAMKAYGEAVREFQHFEEARGLGVALRGLGNVCQFTALYADAADYYRRALTLAESVGDRRAAACAEHNLGNIHAALGEFDLAESAYRRAIAAQRRLGRGRLLHAMAVSAAAAALQRGRPVEALRRLASARRLLGRATPHAGVEAESLTIASAAERRRGRLDEAGALATQALQLARSAADALIETRALRERAAAHLAAKRVAEADADLQGALAVAKHFGLPTLAFVEVHELAAEVSRAQADWRRGFHHLDEARKLRAVLARRSGELQARNLTLKHELVRARQATEAANAARERMGEALARHARATPASPTVAPERGSEQLTAEALRPLGLTARESEVLLWLVRGKSNAEIGVIVGCGGETVKSHLRRVFGKLGVNSRLAAMAHVLDRVPARAG